MGNHKKEIKNKLLLQISWDIGRVAFIGGWIIFLTWAGGRYIGARDFENLEIIGFYWIYLFFFLSLLALVLLFIYILINIRRLHLKIFFTGLIILVNIPSALIILEIQGNIEDKVFVKLTNESGLDISELKLQGNYKTWNLGNLNQGSSKVFNYDPPYFDNDNSLGQKPDTLKLIITHNRVIDTVEFPTINIGDCEHLILNKNLKIKSP